MHFNSNHHASNVRWFLDKTPLCHPSNFIACLFVSDWDADDVVALSDIKVSKFGVPVRTMACLDNARGPSRWSAYHGFLMYQCFAKTVQSATAEWRAHGILFLADDSVIVQPWPVVRTRLQAHGSMMLPDPEDWRICGANLRSLAEDEAACGMQFVNQTRDKDNLLEALDTLPTKYKLRLGVNDSSAPFMWASGDVVYLPLRQASEFQQLADHFAAHNVFEENALPMIAMALGSGHLGTQEGLQLSKLGYDERPSAVTILQKVRSLRQSDVAFIHPVKLGMQSGQNLSVLEELYADVFNPLGSPLF